MYPVLKHSHMLLAIVALLFSVMYTLAAWKDLPAKRSTLWYVLTRVAGGLAALTGLAVTFAGPWRHMAFPYIALILYVVHGLCCGMAKRQLMAPVATTRRTLLAAQLLALVVMWALMAIKPV